MRMQLYPTIDPSSFFGRRQIKADVIVVLHPTQDGELQPVMLHLLKVYS